MAPPSGNETARDEEPAAVGCFCFGWLGGGGGAKTSSSSSSTAAKGARSVPLKSALKPSRFASNGASKEPEKNEMEDHDEDDGVRQSRRASMGEKLRRASIYFEAQDGIIEEASLEFFDAVQDLDEEEGKVPVDDDQEEKVEDEVYPIITRALPPSQSFRVSMLEPETMLRNPKRRMAMDTFVTDTELYDEEHPPPPPPIPVPTASLDPSTESSPPPSPQRSERTSADNTQMSFARRTSEEVSKELREPVVAVEERGYPGLLDERELEECQQFYHQVTSVRKGTIRDIVFAYKDFEEEPYTICRFLRPTKFNSAEMLSRLEENKATWENAAKADFYPDLKKAMGIPQTLFWKFYPFFYQGNAKNGCPVNYFKLGKINVEGLLSILTMEKISYNAWNACKYVFPKMIKKAQEKDPNFVRCESINVMDLEGLTSSQASSEAMEIVKISAKVADFFPETMHCAFVFHDRLVLPLLFAFTHTRLLLLLLSTFRNPDRHAHSQCTNLVLVYLANDSLFY